MSSHRTARASTTSGSPAPAQGRSLLVASPPAAHAAGLALLRAIIAVVMIAHGAQKVFTYTLDGTAASFAEMGVPLASVSGPALAIFELVGGVILLAGLGTRIITALNAAAMLGALVIVHAANGFYSMEGGYEYVLVLAVASVTLVLVGPGAWSVDALLARRSRVR